MLRGQCTRRRRVGQRDGDGPGTTMKGARRPAVHPCVVAGPPWCPSRPQGCAGAAGHRRGVCSCRDRVQASVCPAVDCTRCGSLHAVARRRAHCPPRAATSLAPVHRFRAGATLVRTPPRGGDRGAGWRGRPSLQLRAGGDDGGAGVEGVAHSSHVGHHHAGRRVELVGDGEPRPCRWWSYRRRVLPDHHTKVLVEADAGCPSQVSPAPTMAAQTSSTD